MRLFHILQKLTGRYHQPAPAVPEYRIPPKNSPQVQGKVWKIGEKVKPKRDKANYLLCPNCAGTHFHEGPSGGISTNIECADCHHCWNSNTIGMSWEFIGLGERYHQLRVMAKFARRAGGIPTHDTSV